MTYNKTTSSDVFYISLQKKSQRHYYTNKLQWGRETDEEKHPVKESLRDRAKALK